VGPSDDESVASGGISLHLRHTPLAAQLVRDLAVDNLGGGAERAAGGGGHALVRAVLAHAEGISNDAAMWRAVASVHYGQRLVATLIVAGYALSQAHRHLGLFTCMCPCLCLRLCL